MGTVNGIVESDEVVFNRTRPPESSAGSQSKLPVAERGGVYSQPRGALC